MGGLKSLKHANASSPEFKYVQYVGGIMRASVAAHTKPTNGVFLTACVQHEMAWTPADSKKGPFGPTISGCTHAEAVGAWVNKGSSKSGKTCKLRSVDMADDFATLSAAPCNAGVFKN